MTIPLLRYMPPGTRTAHVVRDILHVCFPTAQQALDVTWGLGRFWEASPCIDVTGTDLEPEFAPHGVQDFRCLPSDWGARFDVVCFDPPHVADAGASGIMGNRYGSYRYPDMERVVRQGCRECFRVARQGALVKVTDAVHGGRLVRMSRWVTDELGEPFDIVHQTRTRSLIDPKWGLQQHAYNNGSTFLVFRWTT
jgi:hypothetical protein